jgi:hypothetical protein
MGGSAIASMQRFVVNIKAFFRYSGLAWVVCVNRSLSGCAIRLTPKTYIV